MRQTDGRTDGQTDGQTDGIAVASTALAKRRAVKCFPILLYGKGCPLAKTNSLNYIISSSFREMFNVISFRMKLTVVYLCRSMYNCSNIEDILHIIKRRFCRNIAR